jgi:hypothetical protein
MATLRELPSSKTSSGASAERAEMKFEVVVLPVADVDRPEAEKHHDKYEPIAPKHHWSGWYAAYIVARQDGKTPEEAAKDGKFHIEGER